MRLSYGSALLFLWLLVFETFISVQSWGFKAFSLCGRGPPPYTPAHNRDIIAKSVSLWSAGSWGCLCVGIDAFVCLERSHFTNRCKPRAWHTAERIATYLSLRVSKVHIFPPFSDLEESDLRLEIIYPPPLSATPALPPGVSDLFGLILLPLSLSAQDLIARAGLTLQKGGIDMKPGGPIQSTFLSDE
jgi:hypothetical protein